MRVRAASVDRGTWHLMTGLPYAIRLAGFGVRRPRPPTRAGALAGTVESVGKDVTEFKPGDEVYGTCDGSFAEYARARAGQARTQAGEPLLRAGRGRPDLRAVPRCRPSATGAGAARAEGADHRRVGRRRHVRRADREGLRRRGHRRVQHRQGRPGPIPRRRPRHRLHPRRLRRRRAPLRRRSSTSAATAGSRTSAAPSPRAERSSSSAARPADAGSAGSTADSGRSCCPVREPEAGHAHVVGERRRPDGAPRAHRVRQAHTGDRPDLPAERDPSGHPVRAGRSRRGKVVIAV